VIIIACYSQNEKSALLYIWYQVYAHPCLLMCKIHARLVGVWTSLQVSQIRTSYASDRCAACHCARANVRASLHVSYGSVLVLDLLCQCACLLPILYRRSTVDKDCNVHICSISRLSIFMGTNVWEFTCSELSCASHDIVSSGNKMHTYNRENL
jgi:hypothetical protein